MKELEVDLGGGMLGEQLAEFTGPKPDFGRSLIGISSNTLTSGIELSFYFPAAAEAPESSAQKATAPLVEIVACRLDDGIGEGGQHVDQSLPLPGTSPPSAIQV